MVKNYILDTSVILSGDFFFDTFKENNIVITFTVLNELDSLKKRRGFVGEIARKNINQIFKITEENETINKKVIINEHGGTLEFYSNGHNYDLNNRLGNSNDDNIIKNAKSYADDNAGHENILISQDRLMLIKAKACGIKCEDFKNNKPINNDDQIFTGVEEILIPDELVDKLQKEHEINISDIKDCFSGKYYPNLFFILKSNQPPYKKSALGIYKKDKIYLIDKKQKIKGVTPKNSEQSFFLKALNDNNIFLVSAMGVAGSGKTFMALAASLNMIESGKYDKLVIVKTIQPVGRDLGFLPGDLETKLDPWLKGIEDNISQIDQITIEQLKNDGKLEYQSIEHIKGRTIPNSIIMIEEAQDASANEIRAIITRAGENSKVILSGDIDQIDNPHLNIYNCGLTHVIEKLKILDITAHVFLSKCLRSNLVSNIVKIL